MALSSILSIIKNGIQAVANGGSSAAKQSQSGSASSGGSSAANYYGSTQTPTSSAGGNTGYTAKGTHYDATAAQNDAAVKRSIEAAQKAWADAQAAGNRAGMDSAHAEAERLRGLLGYSGGVDGSDYIGLQKQNQNNVGQWNIGAPEYPFQWDSYQDFYDQNGYSSAMDAQRAAIDAYIQQTVNGINAQKQTVGQDADALARQAFVSNMQAKQTLPQQLSAAGFSGGLADSHMIGLDTTLQNNQTQIMTERDKMLNELEMAAINAQLSGDQQAAEQAAALYQAAISAWNNYTGQANQYAQSDFWNGANLNSSNYWNEQGLALDRDQLNASNQQFGVEQAYRNAMNLLQMGVMPDESVLSSAGMTSLEAQNYIDRVRQQEAAAAAAAAAKGKGSGGGSKYDVNGIYDAMSTSSDPYLYLMSRYKDYGITASAANQVWDNYVARLEQAFDGGDRSQAVIDGLLKAGYTMDDLIAAGYVPPSTATTHPIGGGGGLTPPRLS